MRRDISSMLVRSALGLCFVLHTYCTGQIAVGQGQNPAKDPLAVITLKPYLGDLVAIDVTVGDSTLPFLFDTGGGITCITPELAASAGCIPFGRLTGYRSIGERLDMQRCGSMQFSIGSADLEVEPGVFDLMSLIKKQGDVSAVGGMVSLDLFDDRLITLDFARHTLVIESSASLAERVKSMNPLSVRFSRQAGGAALDIFVEVKAKTGTIWLELDSGNAGPVRLSPHAIRQLGIDASLNDRLPIALDISGLGPMPNEAYVDERNIDGLLNTIFLKDILLSVDFSSGRAWAIKNTD